MILDRTKLVPPFYANIFSYIPSETREGYAAADEATLLEVKGIDGFLGYEVTGTDTRRIFISYWRDMDAVNAWRTNQTHQKAKSRGKEWYAAYHSMLVKVEHHSLWNPELL
jgi:heme-degrading monooxygenase HmoA